MAKRGRPAVKVGPKEYTNLRYFLKSIDFYTKAQSEFLENPSPNFSDPAKVALLKLNLRQMKAHQERMALYALIQHKGSTSVSLSSLESEILAYDLKDRDGFFSCHRALNIYQKLEKITKSEIERKQSEQWQEKVKKGREKQSDAQKKRIADNRRKYFLGGVLQKYVAFLKHHQLVEDLSEEVVLTTLVENTVVTKFLSDVTNADESKANSVRNSIKSKHVDLLNALNVVAQEIALDSRKGNKS